VVHASFGFEAVRYRHAQHVKWAKNKEDLKPWLCGTADEPGLRALFFGNSTERKRRGVFCFAAGVD